jgi:pyridoxine 4-dehydrogenase
MIEQTLVLGGDLRVHRLGYGAMRLTGQPGNFGPYPHWDDGLRLLRRAVELGVDFIDTAEAYGPGNNEEIIAAALHPYPADLVIATKGGIVKESPSVIYPDGRPQRLRQGVEGSLRRLHIDQIDLYQLHRPDPQVPFAESVGALADLRREGKIRHVGLSNVSIDQLDEARQIVPIASVQNRYSIADRSHEALLNVCDREGIAFIPYAPLDADPMRRGAPLAAAGGVLEQIAQQHGVTPGQIALAWLLQRSPVLLPIPGTTSIAHLEENVAAAALTLSDADIGLLSG